MTINVAPYGRTGRTLPKESALFAGRGRERFSFPEFFSRALQIARGDGRETSTRSGVQTPIGPLPLYVSLDGSRSPLKLPTRRSQHYQGRKALV